MNIDELLEAWRVNNVVTLELLDMCSDDSFESKPGTGKTIRSNFAHIVGTRGEWIKEKFPKAAVPKLDWKTATRDQIRGALVDTEEQMKGVFHRRFEKPGKFGLLTFFTYLVSHEAHHRSQIEIALRLSGAEPADDSAWYTWWDWAKK